jgi:hypothetical protein
MSVPSNLLCTLDQVRKMIGLDAMATEDDDLIRDTLIPSASQMIQNDCQITFGTLQGTLRLDAAHPYLKGSILYFRDNYITGIDRFTSDTGTLTSGMYDLLPLNFTPKYGARLRAGNAWGVSHPEAAFTIEGTLGYGSIPSDVSFAAQKLATWMYQTRDSDGAIQVANNITEIPAQAPPQVHKILSKYKHNLIFA